MKKKLKLNSKASAIPRIDPYLEGLMAKLVERLVRLETKIDAVLTQTAIKPSVNGESAKLIQSAPQKEPARKERVLYEAMCADCHKVCEVPFKPAEGRAVYCKECFARRRSGGMSKFDAAPKPATPSQKEIQPLSAVNAVKQKKSRSSKKAKKK